nr:hypothetical protein [Clostridia bacterium]
METCRNDEMNTLILSVVKDLSNQLEVKSNQPVCLPDKNGVIEIMDLFMGVLFPGFYGKLHVNIAPIEHMISLLLFMAADRLQIQIELAFLHEK